MSARTAILFAVAGTTCPDAQQVFARINAAATRRFPGVEPRWCLTSAPVRRKLAAQGLPAPDPAEALTALQADGFTRIAVVPLHLTDGMEFQELAATVDACQKRAGAALHLALGASLLTSDTAWERALRVVLAALAALPRPPPPPSSAAEAPHRILLVAHGSNDPRGRQTLRHAADLCRTVDSHLMLGLLLGHPGLEETLHHCREQAVRTVWLIPCLALPGFSVQHEITGETGNSWAETLRRAGLEVVPVRHGLAEYDGIVQIWLDTAAELLAKWSPNPGKP